jgi:hypothetical protein
VPVEPAVQPSLLSPGGHVVIDSVEEKAFSFFAGSRSRFVRFAADRRRRTVLALAEYFEAAAACRRAGPEGAQVMADA